MTHHSETAAPMALGDGGNGISKGVAPHEYRKLTDLATAEYAALKVAARLRLRMETARVVCQLAGIGGAL